MRLRSLAAAGLAAVLLVALSACNEDDPSQVDEAAPESSSSSKAPGPEETEAQAQALSAATFQKAVERAQSKKDGRSGHLEATFDMVVAGQSAGLTMTSDFASGAKPEDAMMAVSMNVAGQRMELRLVDGVAYVKAPSMGLPGGKKWASIDIADPSSPFAELYKSADPQSFTAYLAGAENLEDLGAETVDGVETTHYELTVSTKKLLANNERLSGMAPKSMGMPKKLKLSVWLNADRLPVQMKVPFGQMGSFEAHFSDYGKPVVVKAPPAAQVSELGAASL